MFRALQQLHEFATSYNLLLLLEGGARTLVLSAAGCVCGFVLGFALAVLRHTAAGWLLPARILGVVYVEMFRRIPFLVTLFLVFYAFQALGLDVPVFWVAVASTCVIGTAYLSEVVRAGFAAVPRAEWDAAATMNFSLLQTLRFVVVPQAWRVVVPPAFAFFLSFIKDSALASQIGVVELTFVGKIFNNRGLMPAIAFGSVLIAYFVISYPLARLGARLEGRLALSRAH
ncbi:MAG: amino acid ABC transporter permease [Acidisphaera sp.]|nr:amino acid ABC transporter permease [Acidisphaera sp.]